VVPSFAFLAGLPTAASAAARLPLGVVLAAGLLACACALPADLGAGGSAACAEAEEVPLAPACLPEGLLAVGQGDLALLPESPLLRAMPASSRLTASSSRRNDEEPLPSLGVFSNLQIGAGLFLAIQNSVGLLLALPLLRLADSRPASLLSVIVSCRKHLL
jgi:hypothetical protein